MNLFTPRTFSSDWELLVIDRWERTQPARRLRGYAGVLRAELDLPIGVDIDSIEFPLGINTSFAQIWERIRRTTDRAVQLLADDNLTLYPAAAHPVKRVYNSSHVHVGTLSDETAGIRLENRLLRYVPAFVALAANSPAAAGKRGAFKSYRVHDQALGNIRVGMWRDPRFSQRIWGVDAGPKLNLAPTLEVRVIDAASSRRLLAELAVFVAAFVHALGTRDEDDTPDPACYRDYLVNRYAAARDGLQATFRWDGDVRPSVEVLEEMLDTCAEALAILGASRTELSIINNMLRKRICQADMVQPLLDRYPDPYLLASAYGKCLRDWTWFEEYLDAAVPLEPRPALDEEAIDRSHLAVIGEGTPLYRTREVMSLPPPDADAVLDRLLAAGLITREITPEHGIVLSRV